MKTRRIYVLAPDFDKPSGGIKILYRHVDVLNANGFTASVLHQKHGYRCSWFDNQTPIACLPEIRFEAGDFLVIPEVFGPRIQDVCNLPNVGRTVKKVIFNQNCRYSFLGHTVESVQKGDFAMPYLAPEEFVATIVVSEDSRAYLEHAFPDTRVLRIHNAINTRLFAPPTEKAPQICFMPRKHAEDALQVLAILKLRGALTGFEVTAIDNMNEAQVAGVMRNSAFFLSFGYPEGCPLPPAEAMACGCVVIGYDGFGGREYFREAFSYPITIGDIVGYSACVEENLAAWKADPGPLLERGRQASAYVRSHYSSEREANDIVSCWEEIFSA